MMAHKAKNNKTGTPCETHFNAKRNGITMIAAMMCGNSMYCYNMTRGGL